MSCVRLLAIVPLVVGITAGQGGAQAGRDSAARGGADSVRPPARLAPQRASADSLQAPVSPGRAFLHSLFLPGLGQSRLQRPMAGAIYAAVEALSVVMLLKAQGDLRLARERVDVGIVRSYRVDPVTGAPILSGEGAFQPLDSLPNEFGPERIAARRALVIGK